MNYVMADIHGEYDKFLEMLEKIEFSDSDNLFILGDMVDRGPKPMELLMDLAGRYNVYCLLGNHEYMMLKCLKALEVEITEDNYDTQISVDVMQGYLDWMQNGGEITLKQYRKLCMDDREMVLDFLEDLDLYEMLRVNGRDYLLVHAGLMNFSPGKAIDDYLPEELIFARPDFETPYFERITTIVGHTPTIELTGSPEILRKSNFMNIDCGATFPEGRLACSCLETEEVFYV